MVFSDNYAKWELIWALFWLSGRYPYPLLVCQVIIILKLHYINRYHICYNNRRHFTALNRYLFYHLLPYLDNGKMLIEWVVPQYLKKYAVTFFVKIFVFTALCKQRVFQRAFCTNSLDPFEKWTFIFVHFHRAMPFLFWTFIESE
jgi:hypothetical protein